MACGKAEDVGRLTPAKTTKEIEFIKKIPDRQLPRQKTGTVSECQPLPQYERTVEHPLIKTDIECPTDTVNSFIERGGPLPSGPAETVGEFPPFDITGFGDCQICVIIKLDRSFSENKPKVPIQTATGAGKTLTTITAQRVCNLQQ